METNKQSYEELVYSKFFTQRSTFFTNSKRLLVIKFDCLTLNCPKTPSLPDETFLFKDINSVDTSLTNDREFSLRLKKDSVVTLQCSLRADCLCEIYRAFDRYTSHTLNNKPHIANFGPLAESKFPKTRALLTLSSDARTIIEIDLTIFRGHLEIEFKQIEPLSFHSKASKDPFWEEVVPNTKSTPKAVTYILFSHIHTLYKTAKGIIITTRDSHTMYEFIIVNLDQRNDLLSKIQQNHKQYINCYIDIQEDFSRDDQYIFTSDTKKSSRFTESLEGYRKSNLLLRSSTSPQHSEYMNFKGSAYSGGSVDSPKTFDYINALYSSTVKQNTTPSNDSINFEALQLGSPKFSFTPKNEGEVKQIRFLPGFDSKQTQSSTFATNSEGLRNYNIPLRSPMHADSTESFGNRLYNITESPYNAGEYREYRKDSYYPSSFKHSMTRSSLYNNEDYNSRKQSQTFSSFLGIKSTISSKLTATSKSYYDATSPMYSNPFMNIDTTTLDKAFLAYYRVYKIFENGKVLPIILGLTENYVFELEFRSWFVLQKYTSSAVECISQPPDLSRIEIAFKDEVMVTYIVLDGKLEILLNNLVMLIIEQRSTTDIFFLQRGFIHSNLPRNCHKIKGWSEPEPDLDYQLTVIKQFCIAQNEKQFYTALQEFSLNGNLRAYTDREPKPLELLVKLFCTNIKLLRKKRFLSLWKSIQDQTQLSEQILTEKTTMSYQARNKLISEKSDQSPTSHTSQDNLNLTAKSDSDSPNKKSSMELTQEKVLVYLSKSEEILKTIVVLMSSKMYFKEFTKHGKSMSTCEEFLNNVVYLIDSPYMVLSQLAGSFLRAFICFQGQSEKKIERLNRKLLLSPRINLMHSISRILLNKLLVCKKPGESIEYHSIYGCLLILKELVCENLTSMDSTDQGLVFQCLGQPFFFAIFNSLAKCLLVSSLYITTIVMISLLQNYENPDHIKIMQKRCLQNSTTIPLHIAQVLSSTSRYQRKASMTLLYCILKENHDAHLLISRIFPSYMFKLVENVSNDLCQWTFADWSRFFITIKKDVSTPNEQWDQKCREELTEALVKLDQDISAMYARCSEEQIEKILDLQEGDRGEFLINIRWNFEDFEMKYSTLEAKTKVDKYYLDGLLEDRPDPRLLVEITNPQRFWNELSIYIMNAQFKSDIEKTLKVMILVYTKYYKDIGELQTMSSYLKFLVDPFYQEYRYLIIQLIYVALSLHSAGISSRNIQLFMAEKGLTSLAMTINSSFFTENHNHEVNEDDTEVNDAEVVENMALNYTTLNVPKQGAVNSYKDSNIIYFILNIFRIILKQNKHIEKAVEASQKMLYPPPAAKKQIVEENVLRCLTNILLLSDDELIIELLELISDYILDISTHRSLINNTPLIDFLLFNMNSRTIMHRASLILQLYKIISMNFSKEQDPIKIYINSYSDTLHPKHAQEAIKLFPIFNYLPKSLVSTLIIQGVREFSQIFFSGSHESPSIIWNTSMRQNLQQSLNTHCQAYKQELLDYKLALNNYSKEDMPVYTGKFTEDLYPDLQDEVQCGSIFLRIWNRKAFNSFKLNDKEVSAFIFDLYSMLRNVISTVDNGSESQRSSPRHSDHPQRSDNLKRTLSCHTLENLHKPLDSMLIILKAHVKAIRLFKLGNYQCFKEVVETLQRFSGDISSGSSPTHSEASVPEVTHCISFLCRIIFFSISIESSKNLEHFLKEGGLSVLIEAFNTILKLMSLKRYHDHHNHQLELRLFYPHVKTLNIIFNIIKIIIGACPTEFDELSNEEKSQLFLCLQCTGKISAKIFEALESKSHKEVKASDTKKNSLCEHNPDMTQDEPPPQNQSFQHFTAALENTLSEPLESYSDICFKKALDLTDTLLDIVLQFTLKAVFMPFLIRSGVGWRLLEFVTYYTESVKFGRRLEEHKNSVRMKNATQKGCFILRNLLIYANESYIIRSRKTPGDPDDLRVISSQAKSEQIESEMETLGDAALKIVARFYVAVLNLISRNMMEAILADYSEAKGEPRHKDGENVAKFLEIFAGSFYDPSTLWNDDIRDELRSLMENQLLAINNTKGKSCFNQIESFQYTAHKKYLSIEKIFVSLYNKSPQWKIKDPSTFVIKTLEKAAALWKNLKELISNSKEGHYENNDISSTLFNLNEAIAAILNVITHNSLDDMLLIENRISPIASLLSDKRTRKIEDPYVINLKMTALLILERLSRTPEGALRLFENVSFIKNSLFILRSNTKESSMLIPKVLKILNNTIKHNDLNQTLVNYGFWITLLKLLTKTEIHPRHCRTEALRLFLETLNTYGPESSVAQTLDFLFPPNIKRLLFIENDSEVALDYFDNGYESPKVIWTKLMRYEILYSLHQVGEAIQTTWNQYASDSVRVFENFVVWQGLEKMTRPIFPEIQENLNVDGIYLRTFNRDPVLENEDDLMSFLKNVTEYADQIYDEFIEKVMVYEMSGKTTSQTMSIEEQKKLDRLSCAMVTFLTSLLIGLDRAIHEPIKEFMILSDRLHSNDKTDRQTFNPFINEEKSLPPMSERKQALSGPIDEKVILFVLKCMEMFEHSKVHLHILNTEMQIIYLLVDDFRGFLYLKNHDLIPFVANLLAKISGLYPGKCLLTHIEEKLTLYLLQKLILKDTDLIPDAIDECMEHLQRIQKGPKTYLKSIVQDIMDIMLEHINNSENAKEEEVDMMETFAMMESSISLNKLAALESIWKPLNSGFKPYQANNILSLLRKKPKDTQLEFPAISDFSFVPLPHMSGENLTHEKTIRQYITKIIEENSNSTDCTYMN